MAGIPGAHRRAHTPPLRALHRRSCTWSRSRTRTAACPEASRSGSKGSCVPLYRTASYSLIQAPFPLGFDRVGALRVLFWAYDQGRRHRQRVQQSRVLEEGIRRDRRDGVRHGEGHAGARREDQALGIRQLRRAREEIARRPQPADGPGDRDFRPPCTDVPAFASAEERPEQAGLRRGSPIDGRRTGCYDAAPAEPYRGVAQPGSALAWGASGRWFKSSRPDHKRPLIFRTFSGRSGASSFGFWAAGSKLVAKVAAFLSGTTGAGARSSSGPKSSLATAARMSSMPSTCV